jgi:hypothetical protein
MFSGQKSKFVICDNLGNVLDTFVDLNSAKYMLTNYNLGDSIYEVVIYKNKIIANLGQYET